MWAARIPSPPCRAGSCGVGGVWPLASGSWSMLLSAKASLWSGTSIELIGMREVAVV